MYHIVMNEEQVFDLSYIDRFSEQLDSEIYDNAYNKICSLLALATEEICKNKPVITSYDFSILNECLTFSETQATSLDIAFVIKSPYIEINSRKIKRNTIKYWWKNFKISWSASWKKKKKKKLEITPKVVIVQDITKYDLTAFKNELTDKLSKYITDESMIEICPTYLKIVGKDFGINVNVYILLDNSTDMLKLYNTQTQNFILFSLGKRQKKISQKLTETNEQVVKYMRIFNNLYFFYMQTLPNQIILESVVCNCPNDLFVKNDNNQLFLNLTNYIAMHNILNIKSVTDEQELCKCVLTKYSINDFIKFINIIRNLL